MESKYKEIDNSIENLLMRVHKFPRQVRHDIEHIENILMLTSPEFYEKHGDNYMRAIECLESNILEYEIKVWKGCYLEVQDQYLMKVSKLCDKTKGFIGIIPKDDKAILNKKTVSMWEYFDYFMV
jgi:hypothetical protein